MYPLYNTNIVAINVTIELTTSGLFNYWFRILTFTAPKIGTS